MSRRFRPGLRRWFHGSILLIGAEILFLCLASTETTYSAMDKKLHFEAGRTAAIVAYFMATMVIIGRILGSHGHRSFRIELSRIPIVSIVCLGSAYVLSFLLAVGKEYLDTMSRGSLDALDIFATLDGTVCLLVPMIGVIVLCYLLTPIDRLILRLAVDRGGFGY